MSGDRSFLRLLSATLFAFACQGAAASVLLLHDGDSLSSELDCLGIERALGELGIARERVDVRLKPVSAMSFEASVVVACHLDFSLDLAGAQALGDWVFDGGGLLATGRSGLGLQAVLGLASVTASDGNQLTEVRFTSGHPATDGIGWDGPIAAGTTLPASQLPAIARHYYYDESQDGWPSYEAVPWLAETTGHWRDSSAPWGQPDGAVATTAVGYGDGRAIYSGALPGVYVNWDWPRSWQTVVERAVQWLARDEALAELGLWPDAHTAALAWSGDTEKPAMETAVPALLDLFEGLGLQGFGTFYTVGRAGGDAGTSGAQEHPGVVQAILAAGSELAGHGDVHTSFNGQSYAEQYQRLDDMRGLIEPMMPPGERLSGFRAPYLSQDSTTWQALADLGFTHDSGDADTWSNVTLPHFRGDLLQLPPSMPMDWHLFEQYDLSAADAQAIWFDKLDYVVSRRGLFSWLHHPWVIEPHLDVVDNLLAYAISRGDIWMARQDEIAEWWLARSALEMQQLTASGDGVRVRVSNPGSAPVAGASVWVKAPAGAARPWQVRIDGQSIQPYERVQGDFVYRVAVVESLAPGEAAIVEMIPRDRVFHDRFVAPAQD